MFKKQLTIAFTIALFGATSAAQLRQLSAPTLEAPLEAAPLVEALPTQEVSAVAAAPQANPVFEAAPLVSALETADNIVMSDEGAQVESIFRGRKKEIEEDEDEERDEDSDEEEEPEEDKFEEVFDVWQGEGILNELFRPRKHHRSSRRNYRRSHDDNDEDFE